MPIYEIDFQILTLRAAELILEVLHQLVGLRTSMGSEPREPGQVQLDIYNDQGLGACCERAVIRQSIRILGRQKGRLGL